VKSRKEVSPHKGLGLSEDSYEMHIMISDLGHEVDALGHAGEEGRKKGHERAR
jgi:hypothetical protein